MTNDEMADAFGHDTVGCVTSVGANHCEGYDTVRVVPELKAQVRTLWQQVKQLHHFRANPGDAPNESHSFVIRPSSFV